MSHDQDDETRTCTVCTRRELTPVELQTCTPCIGNVRTAVARLAAGHQLLAAEAAAKAKSAPPMDPTGIRGNPDYIPGGDAMVMLAAGSTRWHGIQTGTDGVDSILGVLDRIETDWRKQLGSRAATGPATISSCTEWILNNLAYAAQRVGTFAEDAQIINRLAWHVDRITGQSDPLDLGAPCPYCGTRLIRRYADPNPYKNQAPQREHREACAIRYWSKGKPGENGACSHHLDDPDHWTTGSEPYDQYRLRLDAHWARHANHDQGGAQDDSWVCSNRECRRTFDDRSHRMAIWQHHNDEAS